MSGNAKWELFQDINYYDMWAVRPVGDRDFNSPQCFHFNKYDDAVAFKALIENATCAAGKKDRAESARIGRLEKRLVQVQSIAKDLSDALKKIKKMQRDHHIY